MSVILLVAVVSAFLFWSFCLRRVSRFWSLVLFVGAVAFVWLSLVQHPALLHSLGM
jgi:hypothetical protein